MAEIFYPKELPIPLKDSFGLEPISPFLRTKLTSGRSRQRRIYSSVPTQASVKWSFKKDNEAQLFEAWFRDALTDGVAWFYMRLKTPLGIQPYKCRFVDIYQGPILASGKFWQFTATLELWERPLLPPGWGLFPELVAGSDIIDLALNKEWPEA
ncbi:hypothetical protein [Enterobacter roggenkampii]|uniref:hypothetical protein n=1 Tax=Enterobacter roggenkampii TaxID=1812935 RepID=UPI0020069617|nr:hypothetical protein [Enterobacter roggenkampii]MCK6977698.1 hypothetical protein [Enterobacter roggenkampii]